MPTALPVERETLSIEELAARLGINRGLAYELARTDRLPVSVLRLGRRMVVGREALARVLAGELTCPPPQAEHDGRVA